MIGIEEFRGSMLAFASRAQPSEARPALLKAAAMSVPGSFSSGDLAIAMAAALRPSVNDAKQVIGWQPGSTLAAEDLAAFQSRLLWHIAYHGGRVQFSNGARLGSVIDGILVQSLIQAAKSYEVEP